MYSETQYGRKLPGNGAGLSRKDAELVIDQMLDLATDAAFRKLAKGLAERWRND